MDKAVLKKAKRTIESYDELTEEDRERMNARKSYKNVWEDYKKLQIVGNKCFRIFLNEFYNLENDNGVKLCEIKGVRNLVRDEKKKNPITSAYLDFITKDELVCLSEALHKIPEIIKESYNKDDIVSFLNSRIKKLADDMREEFKDNHNNMYPEQIPGCEYSVQVVIKPSTKLQEKDSVLTSEPRVKEQEKIHYAQLINEDGIVDNQPIDETTVDGNQPIDENIVDGNKPIDEIIVDGNKPIKENDIHDAQPINENGIVNQPTNVNVMNDKQPVEKNPSRLQKIKEAPKKFVRYVKNKIFGDDGRDM